MKTLVISGISGAGKSTLAEMLKNDMSSRGTKCTIIDGDSCRSFFEGALQYSANDRLMVSKVLSYAAFLLNAADGYVILATMLSQPGAREFLRAKVSFTEIFLDVSLDACVKNDAKGVYEHALTKEKPEVVGHDLLLATPTQPDLVIQTHLETPQKSFSRITHFLSTKQLFGYEQ